MAAENQGSVTARDDRARKDRRLDRGINNLAVDYEYGKLN